MRMLCGFGKIPLGQLQAVEGAWLKFWLTLRARYLSLTPPFRNPASATAVVCFALITGAITNIPPHPTGAISVQGHVLSDDWNGFH